MNKDYEVLKRIDSLLEKKGVTQQDLIEHLGLARGAYSNWNRMTSNSYLSYLSEISEFFKVTPNYLFLGEIEIPESLCSKDEADLLDCYRKVGKREKSYIRALAHEMLK